MSLPEISLKWSCLALLIVEAIILHQIPQPIEVTLHLLTGRMSFFLPGTDDALPLIESLPLTSLSLSGLSSLSLEVQDLREEGQLLVSSESRIILKALSRESQLTFKGEEKLRLMRLMLASRAQVILYTDQERHVLMRVWNPQVSQVELAVLGRFTLTVQDLVLLDEQGKNIPFISFRPIHTLEVTPSIRNLVFEQEEEAPFELVLDFAQQIGQRQSWDIPLSFDPRLKVSHLDFTREESHKRVSEIHQLRIEPLMSEDMPEEKVYLKVRERDVFTLQSVSLSEKGLECELIGNTDTLMVGKDGPNKNRVPSLLFSVLYSKPLKKTLYNDPLRKTLEFLWKGWRRVK
jgi:hypothetical protein